MSAALTPATRVKVGCINWSQGPDAPRAVSYLFDEASGLRGDAYHATWEEAIDRANWLIGMLSRLRAVHR